LAYLNKTHEKFEKYVSLKYRPFPIGPVFTFGNDNHKIVEYKNGYDTAKD